MELEPIADVQRRAKYELALDTYEQVGGVREACRVLKINYQTWKKWKHDPVFKEMFEERQEEVCHKLEAEAFKRAVDGETEDVWFKGQVVGQRKKKSDYLLVNLLQANMPEKYRNNVNVNQSGEMKILHQGAIEQLNTVRIELASDPKYLEFLYQSEDTADNQPSLICSGSHETPEAALCHQQPPEAD